MSHLEETAELRRMNRLALRCERIQTERDAISLKYRQIFECDVCCNWPDEDGHLEHGKGCYTQDEDGDDYIEECDLAKLFKEPKP